MGALALREHEPMLNQPSTDLDPETLKAATAAVRRIAARTMELGGSRRQADAVAEAMRLMLLGHEPQAQSVLSDNFPPTSIDLILGQIKQGLRAAA